MFGKRKVPPVGGSGSEAPPPSGKEPFPIEKMDYALECAIRLFTRTLEGAGVDCGGLAIRGPVPDGVSALVANCTTFNGEEDGSPSFLALGATPDFKAVRFTPHCRLYFILNSVAICEDVLMRPVLGQLAPAQLPAALIDAHFLRCWIHFILPTGNALTAGAEALDDLFKQMAEALVVTVRQTPPAFAAAIDMRARFEEWALAFPFSMSQPLHASVRRMNGLPVTPFIEEVLTEQLASLQAEGLRQRPAA